jgi:predicted nucleic acid-binding protein
MATRAMHMAHEAGRTAVYDTLYAALAEQEACEVWTADERFWNGVKTRYAIVRCIADPTLQILQPPRQP